MIVDVDCLHIGHVEVVDEWLMVVVDLDVVQVVEMMTIGPRCGASSGWCCRWMLMLR